MGIGRTTREMEGTWLLLSRRNTRRPAMAKKAKRKKKSMVKSVGRSGTERKCRNVVRFEYEREGETQRCRYWSVRGGREVQ